MTQRDILRKQIGLVQQSIWRVEQARELFNEATGKDPERIQEFNDLLEGLEFKLDLLNDQLNSIEGN